MDISRGKKQSCEGGVLKNQDLAQQSAGSRQMPASAGA